MLRAELIAEGKGCRIYALEKVRGSGKAENFFLDFLLDELEKNERSGVLALIERIADYGRISGLPKHLRDDVWELKVQTGEDPAVLPRERHLHNPCF